jgi:hypothetical protein
MSDASDFVPPGRTPRSTGAPYWRDGVRGGGAGTSVGLDGDVEMAGAVVEVVVLIVVLVVAVSATVALVVSLETGDSFDVQAKTAPRAKRRHERCFITRTSAHTVASVSRGRQGRTSGSVAPNVVSAQRVGATATENKLHWRR